MENIIKELQNELRTRFFMDGENHPKISAVKVYRFTDERIEMPQTDNPYLYIVLDGMLRLYTPSGIMDYMAGQYSVSKIDTPLSGTVLAFSEQQDFLAISIEFTPSDVIQTILELDNELTERIMSEQLSEQKMTLSDSEVLQSVSRLFSVMNHQTVPSEFIRKNIMQEITYYVLCGSCGKQFIQSIAGIGQAEEIYQANSWIKKNFHNSFAVEDLAKRQNMSVSLFHQKFKSAVGMGPLQCQKRLRLTEARLMLDESKNVTEASVEVGYESLSQFIRDYRRMFRAAPKEDILNIQKHLKK